jgi:glutamate carboxypeptidase
MNSRDATASVLDAAAGRLGRPICGADRGGASDASYLAPVIEVTVDGLGPLGGGAHTPSEFIVASSLRSRAEVALALVDAVLGTRSRVRET